MKAKSFITTTIALVLVGLIMFSVITIAIDPLFQYHIPWFGLEPVITNERYQNAGIAKNFDFENVIIGNSMSENFKVNDANEAFGGSTVKLVAAGSHTIDWTYTLDILQQRDESVKSIMFNLDPYIFIASSDEMRHELPTYLYNHNILDDVSYLFNFEILNDYTIKMLKENHRNNIPEYNEVFCWENPTGKDFVLSNYDRPEDKSVEFDDDIIEITNANLDNIIPYIESMKDTNFVFFFSPFSIIYWDSENQMHRLSQWRDCYLDVSERLLQYDNVSLYFWSDEQMLDIICNLDYYSDEAHYSAEISENLLNRIGKKQGIITNKNYEQEINRFFDFLESYDYESIFT